MFAAIFGGHSQYSGGGSNMQSSWFAGIFGSSSRNRPGHGDRDDWHKDKCDKDRWDKDRCDKDRWDKDDCSDRPKRWSASEVKDGKGQIDLGSNVLKFDEKDSSMKLENKQTGQTTSVWGDPHLKLPASQGGKDMMFRGPLTFRLDDKTRITLQTEQAKNNPNVTYTDKVTVTRGNQAYVVNGLSEQKKGDLTIERKHNGRELSKTTPTGYELREKQDGSGWISTDTGRAPTQEDLKRANA